jgi:AcrR family transcriptional regulator
MKRGTAYHHGNLRQALLEAARELVHEVGVEHLTLREVARRAGVTTAAPYHHFADKAALVYALAHQSLAELDQVSAAAIIGIDDPQEQLYALGTAYVLYAIDHPTDFRLMFRPEMGAPFEFADPTNAPVLGVLLRVVSACHERAALPLEGVQMTAISAWSLVHGLAALLVDGPLAPMAADRAQVEALASTITRRLMLS